MKKVVFFIPAVIAAVFYGFMLIGVGFHISPMVFVWLALFIASGILMCKGMFWGGFLGALPGFHMIYMSTIDTGQIFSELPIGIIVVSFYLVCCWFAFNVKKQKNY